MNEKKKFTFMESYMETVEQLKEYDPTTACELLHAIIEYGLHGTEPTNPLIKSLMVQIKYAIDSGKQISEKNSANGKRGGRPKSERKQLKTEESEENPKKANESEGKQNKNKKEKENKNLNILSSNEDKSASTVEYGNPEVNECLEIIKSFNDGIIDGTQKQNRIDAKNLVGKLKKIPTVQSGEYKRQDTLKAVLTIVSENKYHASKITSPGSIYRNLAVLFHVCKQEGMNQPTTIQVL